MKKKVLVCLALMMISNIYGNHYRVTRKQWDDLSIKMKIEGASIYFVLDHRGHISYKAIDFPGVDKTGEELNKANDN